MFAAVEWDLDEHRLSLALDPELCSNKTYLVDFIFDKDGDDDTEGVCKEILKEFVDTVEYTGKFGKSQWSHCERLHECIWKAAKTLWGHPRAQVPSEKMGISKEIWTGAKERHMLMLRLAADIQELVKEIDPNLSHILDESSALIEDLEESNEVRLALQEELNTRTEDLAMGKADELAMAEVQQELELQTARMKENLSKVRAKWYEASNMNDSILSKASELLETYDMIITRLEKTVRRRKGLGREIQTKLRNRQEKAK
ncbi:uncharacterized protein PV07_00774 [Cladophialophora immunda]|uniref:Uncharacterized protein n=1 Tax=Cladophialophora immunda TaxID=569365 RepID=A0A0D2CS13_9EURO|nr:uncharacterized protein PV07_00774 [Cladophialophora immunda]KIW33963.1 hypothetical protein PV07_00774 [Cladophialophora immunda]